MAEPAEQSVTDNAIFRARPKGSAFHDGTNKIGSDQVLPTLQGTDRYFRDLRWRLGLVGFFEFLGQIRLGLLLVVKAGCEDPHGENGVDLDIRSRGVTAVSLGIGSVVHFDFLAQSIGERTNSCFGRRVRRIASDRNECKGRAGENEMSPGCFHLSTRNNGV